MKQIAYGVFAWGVFAWVFLRISAYCLGISADFFADAAKWSADSRKGR